MHYELAIHPAAEKEWAKLDSSIKRRFKEKLANERLKNPRIAKDSLRDLPDCYKIKITAPQFRLIYHVNDAQRLLTICQDPLGWIYLKHLRAPVLVFYSR